MPVAIAATNSATVAFPVAAHRPEEACGDAAHAGDAAVHEQEQGRGGADEHAAQERRDERDHGVVTARLGRRPCLPISAGTRPGFLVRPRA
jgi:hypothetical protein